VSIYFSHQIKSLVFNKQLQVDGQVVEPVQSSIIPDIDLIKLSSSCTELFILVNQSDK